MASGDDSKSESNVEPKFEAARETQLEFVLDFFGNPFTGKLDREALMHTGTSDWERR